MVGFKVDRSSCFFAVILFFIVFRTGNLSYAQHDYVWAFGAGAGIDFNTNPPTPIKTSIGTMEGTASICDENGQLLFYTDGNTVYNRRHFAMLSGSGLAWGGGSTESTSQGTVIVPMPGDTGKYYIFSLTSWEGGRYNNGGRLYYSIVDMSLHSGLGGVTEKAVLLDTMLTEHMTAVSGNDCNVWLAVVSRRNNSFKSFNIDVNGISRQPVISPSVTPKQINNDFYEWSGHIDFSPDRRKIAIAQEKVVLYDFDIDSGKVYNPVILDTFPVELLDPDRIDNAIFYGVCFSPDNSKLYVTLSEVTHLSEFLGLYQFDLQSSDSLTIVNSKTRITRGRLYSMRRAPNGKIYCTGNIDTARFSTSPRTLNIIHQPNEKGVNCQWDAFGFNISLEGVRVLIGLPNTGTIYTHRRFFSTTLDSSYCSSPRTLTPKHTEGWEYTWNDSLAGPTRVVDHPGIYWVRYKVPINSPCKYDIHVDTFRVVFALTSKHFDTTIYDAGLCKADTVLLHARNGYAGNYFWEDGITGASRRVNRPGNYTLTYQVDSLCEYYRDDFVIIYPEKDHKVSFTSDSIVCKGDTLKFTNTSDVRYSDFSWFYGNGDTSLMKNPEYAYVSPGYYRVMLTSYLNPRCHDTAFGTVTVDSVFPAFFTAAPRSICTGETINMQHEMQPNTLQHLYWQYGDGSVQYTFDQQLQHAFDQAGDFPVTLTASFRACPESTYSDTISVYPLPHVDIGRDTGICFNGMSLLLPHQAMENGGSLRYLWSTGDTVPQIRISHPGTYALTLTLEPSGCSATDYIEISKDCYTDLPNAFTPDGDGLNDYFFPRQLLSKGVTSFRMQVFSRWGQLVFETTNPAGRGWDGKFNDVDQGTGIYIYRVEITFGNGTAERFDGNITLLR